MKSAAYNATKSGIGCLGWLVVAGFALAVVHAVRRNAPDAEPGPGRALVAPERTEGLAGQAVPPGPPDVAADDPTALRPGSREDVRGASREDVRGASREDALGASRGEARGVPRADALGASRPPIEVARQGLRLVEGAPRRGAEDPWVVIVVFSDYECAGCSRLDPLLDQLLAAFPDRLAVQYRQLPLPEHPRAIPAARAALAAARQGAFLAFHEALARTGALEDGELRRQAEKLGLDPARFERDMKDSTIDAALRRDLEDARRFGATSVPTLFVNGLPIRGVQTLNYMSAVVEKELERAERFIEAGTEPSRVYDTILNNEAGKPVTLLGPELLPVTGVDLPASDAALDRGDAPSRGPEHAPVEMIVFSDYQCTHCAELAGTVDRLARTHPKDLSIAFKQYPLPNHRDAELMAIAARAAHKQGRFWSMHDRLFAMKGEVTRQRLMAEARSLHLDAARFEADLDAPDVRSAVKSDIEEGVKLGITGTPTLFINGARVEGAASFEALAQEIRKARR